MAAKERPCAAVSKRPLATSCWCRTPTSNTTRRITTSCWSRFSTDARTWCTARDFSGGPQRVHYFWHYAGNKFLTLLSDVFTNLKLTDMETCYKVFRREVLQASSSNRTASASSRKSPPKSQGNWRIYEVSISYAGRTYAEGKKITWKDGFSTLWCILRFNLFDVDSLAAIASKT